MTKLEFLKILEKELHNIPKQSRADIIGDYEEHFHDAMQAGESEGEIAKKLGDPVKVAKEVKALEAIENVKENLSLNSVFKLFLTLSSLGIFNIIFLFPYLFIVYALASLGFISIIMLVAGLMEFTAGFLNVFFDNFIVSRDPLHSMGYAAIITLVGFVLGVLDILFIKYFYIFTVQYIKMNIKMIRERR